MFSIAQNEKSAVHRSLEKLSLNLHSEQLYHSSMSEKQNIEWKESWRDEYLKWICGFANAVGGKLYIGMDDNGKVVGVDNVKKLSEDIPNKVRDVLGIMVDVNILEENGIEYLEIDVPAYSNPINYKGQYHYRSGSTKQELKGAALNRFILQHLI
jgi:ATP-dependent DNA helicase RecG